MIMAHNHHHPMDETKAGQVQVLMAQRTKTILESRILQLIQEWEAETGCVTRHLSLTHTLSMGQSRKTCSVLITAEL